MYNQNIPRYEKAFKLIEANNVIIFKRGHSIVHSLDGKRKYAVCSKCLTCECEDWAYRKIKCAHIMATLIKSGHTKVVKDMIA